MRGCFGAFCILAISLLLFVKIFLHFSFCYAKIYLYKYFFFISAKEQRLMRIDLDHNKILKETMSEGFRLGLTEGLIPRLSEIYGTALDGVMMYEDHLKDDFKKDDYCYYPLTLVVGGIAKALWIKWSIREGSKFEGGNPYKYLGEKLDFEISEDTPIAFSNAISGKQIYAEGSVKITVSAAVKDFTFLAGKYSQTFIDEMARQLTAVIERASAVKGLAESSIERIRIPDGVTDIGTGAFYNCIDLVSADVSDGVTEITDYLFWRCLIRFLTIFGMMGTRFRYETEGLEKLGKDEIANEYFKRAESYKNIYDAERGLFVAKDKNGMARADFDPFVWGFDYTESGAYQNAFGAPHALDEIASLLGGNGAACKNLDEIFSTPPHFKYGRYGCEIHEMTEMATAPEGLGQCAISNQPSFSLPFLYAYYGDTKKSDYYVKKIARECFTPDSYPGDEDNGSMSAWYIFATIGKYPVCPGKSEYVHTTPLAKFKIREK